MQVLPAALAPLGAYNQFILYKIVPSAKRPGKTDKFPINPASGLVTDAQNVAIWSSFADAAKALKRFPKNYGVGFVLTANDPFWFLDIDGAYKDGEWNAVSQQLCAELQGAAIEISSSGNGVHLFGTGDVPPHSSTNALAKQLGLEFYHEKRFVALTGAHAAGNALYAPPALAAVVGRYFPPGGAQVDGMGDWWSDAPVPEWNGPIDDDQLLQRAMLSTPALLGFNLDKARFVDLYTGDADVLARAYPSSDDAYARSEADQALANHLAFWTGNDAERIKRIMLTSELVRDKWDRPGDNYLERTIRKACFLQKEWLKDAPISASPFSAEIASAPALNGAVLITERSMLMPEEQVSYFAGCVYVVDEHKIMVPDGTLLDASRFNALYGGKSFSMDAANQRTVRKAFEAFTESQVYRFPRADTTCFRPRLPQGAIIRDGGALRVNTWVPVEVPRHKGDVTRFWTHLAKMFPNENDRMIIMGYMATVVQHQGYKLQWAPLIQGTTGNGKSMLSHFVKHAIGKRYCHSPRAKNLDNDFNAWLDGRTFYSVDEVWIPEKRQDVLETLKPMISDDEGIEVTKKGVDSATREICGNFMFMTNHRAAMKKDRHDRRIGPFYTAQQEFEDLERDGLTQDYFRDLENWLKAINEYEGQPTGYSMISELLWTWPIPPKYDARTHKRAPITTSTQHAINETLGVVEQEVLEMIEQREVGFRGGFVSGTFLRKMCERMNRPVSPSKQPDMMKNIGYILHPALVDGRLNNLVQPDNGRPRIYVRKGHETTGSAADIAAAYAAAQLVE